MEIYNTRRKEKQNIYLRGDRRKPRQLKKLLKKQTANSSSKNLLEIFQTWSLVEAVEKDIHKYIGQKIIAKQKKKKQINC